MEYDPLTRKLQENWTKFYETDNDNDSKEQLKSALQSALQVPFLNVKHTSLGAQSSYAMFISLEDKSEWPNTIYNNSTYFTFMWYTPDSSLQLLSSGLPFELRKSNKFRKTRARSVEEVVQKIAKYIDSVKGVLATEVTEVSKAEHEDNLRRAMSSQGSVSRRLSPEEVEYREQVKQWALEHQHEGFDPYDIVFLSQDYTAVYNTKEPDPETGVLGAYYIIQQDIFVSPEEVRKLQGK